MKKYLDLVEKVLTEGKVRPNRTGIDALTIVHHHIEHDMDEGFPLLTTKKMAFKTMLIELEGFLRGITSKKWYQERGCHVWDEWCNPKNVQLILDQVENPLVGGCSQEQAKQFQKEIDDLGPIYGYQWRRFAAPYDHGQSLGTDQLKTILKSIKSNPNDRRMVCSAWSPGQMEEMALPACTCLWKVNILDGKINLSWFQRSCDLMLGLPFDMASSATLLMLLAKYSGLRPGKLSGFLDDVHIYKNHIIEAFGQTKRAPRNLPQLEITVDPFDLEKSHNDIVRWTYKDVLLTGYDPHPKIDFTVAI